MSIRVVAIALICLDAVAMQAQDQASAAKSPITLIAPVEGGTPRDPKKIVDLGNGVFQITSTVEEGKSPLKHAVSRVDLLCRNSSDKPLSVTLKLDLSDEMRRTSYDERPAAGMPLRDFLFIQPTGKEWQQVDGRTDGWTSIVTFAAAPGETKIGLSPWYTYSDLQQFIRSLPDGPLLDKTLIGRSDRGREQWELRITDPATPGEMKKVIFWHAREHAYESFSSFAMEGLVGFLLSNEAERFRRRFVLVLHPMTNVDGVADGYEYRGGYDYPDPRGPATGKLTFQTMDRLRPTYAVAWHNWISPRDADVVFYTDGIDDRPTRRAWDMLTSRFISPRATGHHWLEEGNQLKYNWHGMRLSESNVHQYAMKNYGTRVWGWEMPWWRRTVTDSRRLGASFGRALLSTLDDLEGSVIPDAPESPAVEVTSGKPHEFLLTAKPSTGLAISDCALIGEFKSPAGKVQVIEGSRLSGDAWRLSFKPDQPGDWRYQLRGEGMQVSQHGILRCTNSGH